MRTGVSDAAARKLISNGNATRSLLQSAWVALQCCCILLQCSRSSKAHCADCRIACMRPSKLPAALGIAITRTRKGHDSDHTSETAAHLVMPGKPYWAVPGTLRADQTCAEEEVWCAYSSELATGAPSSVNDTYRSHRAVDVSKRRCRHAHVHIRATYTCVCTTASWWIGDTRAWCWTAASCCH